ncbi:MAG TPA: GvpL/GvpF family gas vesicle protein, partial [Longimicrobiaceae bacterium]|nr:GvpL/GvpF family gas vesicle protein [Longimicrobiaceae bacterium]
MSASEAKLNTELHAEPGVEGLHLLGVVRAQEGEQLPAGSAGDFLLVPHQEIAAFTRPGPFAVPEMTKEEVMLHQRELDQAMQRWTVAPAPFGIVFRDRASVLQFLEEQYQPLCEALTLVEGRWEFRLHIRDEEHRGDPTVARDVATHVYAELRRITHAAVPFPSEGGNLFSAAFLVERAVTSRFLERVEELSEMDRALSLDLTGPWPPYDFVRISVG